MSGGGSGGEWGQLNEGLRVVQDGIDRCLALLQEIKRLEEGLFVVGAISGGEDTSGRSEGMQVGMGGLSRLERECRWIVVAPLRVTTDM